MSVGLWLLVLALSHAADGLARTPFSRHHLQPEKYQPRHVQVLVWSDLTDPRLGQESSLSCSDECHITHDHAHLGTSDVVLFKLQGDSEPLELPTKARRSQRFVAFFDTPATRLSEFDDEKMLANFDGEISYRHDADVWLSTLPPHPVDLLSYPEGVAKSSGDAFVVYHESECGAHSKRDSFVRELMKHMNIDATGSCLQNKNRTYDDVTKQLAQYDFTLVLEADLEPDLVSERLYQALMAGSVPVYAGASNIDDFLPTAAKDCVVKVSDFESPKALADHLLQLRASPPQYRALLQWKSQGLDSKFVHRALSNNASLCSVCEWYRSQPSHPLAPVPADAMAAPKTLFSHDALLGGQTLMQRNVLLHGVDSKPTLDCPDDCSGHGTCHERTCICHNGWRGYDCSREEGACPNKCSNHGVCVHEVCLCDAGWIGEGCERVDPRMQWECERYCGERGVCIDGECRCAEGYCGDDCALMMGTCENDCSGHGSCCDSRCLCESGWWGDKACSKHGPSCPYDFDCNDHGTCMEGKCVCDAGWTDFDCTENVAVLESHRREPEADVIVPINRCPNNCSGHGVCIPDQGCDCDADWQGKACEDTRLTFCPVDYDCANGGQCVKGRCVGCMVGFSGFDCRTEPHPVDAPPPEQAMGERGDMLLFSPLPGPNESAEIRGRAVLTTKYRMPPVVLVQAHDEHAQSIAVASVADTRKPHKFLADGLPDQPDVSSLHPTQNEPVVALMVTQTVPKAVAVEIEDTLMTTPGMSGTSLPAPLADRHSQLLRRPFSYVAMEAGIWALENGKLMIVGSRGICEKKEDGKVYSNLVDDLLTVKFPRKFNTRPVVMTGLMSPMLSAPLRGIVGVIRIERVTLSDFTVRLPSGLCDAITSSRSLLADDPLQTLLELEEGADTAGLWGDDVDEYLDGKCSRFPGTPRPPTNPYAYESIKDWSGTPASERPCYEPAHEDELSDPTPYNASVDAGYGPEQSRMEEENRYPNQQPTRPVRNLPPRPPGLSKLTLAFVAVEEGADSLQGGVRVHATAVDLPATSELVPVDMSVGIDASDSPDLDELRRPTNPHPESMVKDLATLMDSGERLVQNPLTGAWEYVRGELTAKDYPSALLLSTVIDPADTHTVSVAFRPGRELELGVTEAVNDTMDFSQPAVTASARQLAHDMLLLQEAEDDDTTTNATLAPPVPAIAMGEAVRVILQVPAGQHGPKVNIRLQRAYEKPVMIAEPLSKSPLLNEPMVVAVHGVDASTASVSIVKPSAYATADVGDDVDPVTDKANVVVMEEGVYKEGQSLIQVGTVNTDGINPRTGWMRVNFTVAFERVPVVLTQVQTHTQADDDTPLPYWKTRQAMVDKLGFSVAIEGESEAFVDGVLEGTLPGQVIGFVAVDAGDTTIDSWDGTTVHADRTAASVYDPWFPLNFAQQMVSATPDVGASAGTPVDGFAPEDTSTAPVFVAHVTTYKSDAPCHVRLRNLLGDGVDVKLESDDMASPRTSDEKEALGYLVLSKKGIFKASHHPLYSKLDEPTFGVSDFALTGGALFKNHFTKLPPPSAVMVCPGSPICNAHGTCNDTTGHCTCDDFWEGTACDQAKRMYMGENGRVLIDMQHKKHLHEIKFMHTYTDPVLFLGPVTNSFDDVPLVARVASVGSKSAMIFLEHPHRWLNGPPSTHPMETVTYVVLESGVWDIDDQGNSVEVQSLQTSAAAGIESVALAYKRRRGQSAVEGRTTPPVVMTQLQTANNRLLLHSSVVEVQDTAALLTIEAERVIQPSDGLSKPVYPSETNAVRNLRLSSPGVVDGNLTGTLFFDPPKAADLQSLEFVFATSKNASSVVGLPFARLAKVPEQSHTLSFNTKHPSSAKYIMVLAKPQRGNPAYVPILADDENPYHPDLVPLTVDPHNLPLVQETVGVMVLSSGVGAWDNKSYVANTRAPIPASTILQWVDYLDPESSAPRPLVTFAAAPSTYLASVDFEETVLGTIPAHMSLGETYIQSIDRSAAKVRLELERKQDRAREMPTNLTVSYFALVQEGLLSARTAGCPNDCSNNGVCSAGMCTCDATHGGEDCSKEMDPEACVPACEGNSECLEGTCECKNGWTGDKCSIAVADLNPTPQVTELCPRNCSHHGHCDGTKCVCVTGWDGDDCSQPVCPHGCNEPSGGACVHGKCQCIRTYTGETCHDRICHPDPDCAHNGACVNGACVCAAGWHGDDCTLEEPPVVCPNFCSGHGDCNPNGTCACHAGYKGDDCSSLKPCPKAVFLGVEEECGGHGWCDKGVCQCSTGWVGETCIHVDPNWDADCPFNCSGRGKCTPIGCICDEPYGGRGCRQMTDKRLEMGEVKSAIVTISPRTPTQTIRFAKRYRSPVVIAKPPSRAHPTPFSVQILGVGADHVNVTTVQAQLAFMRGHYDSPLELRKAAVKKGGAPTSSSAAVAATDDFPSVSEMVTFVVMEEGSWDLQNGLLVHVGRVPVGRVVEGHGVYQQGFPRFFTEQPAILTQSQSVHSHLLARSRIRSAKVRSFMLGMDVVNVTANLTLPLAVQDATRAELVESMFQDVQLGWVAVGPSTSSVVTSHDPAKKHKFGSAAFVYDARAVQMTEEFHRVTFPAEAALSSPRVVADCALASAFGMRYHALSPMGVSLGFEGADGALVTDTTHTAMVFTLAFGGDSDLRAVPLMCADRCGYDGERGWCEKSKCQCEPGWAGLTCKVPAVACPNNCSDRGACTSAGCRCRMGWVGADCSVQAPRVKVELLSFTGVGKQFGARVAACADNCTGHGECINSVCHCTDPEWLGWKCHIPNPCVRGCSGHGKCIENVGCACDAGWGGKACDVQSLQCPYDYDCWKGQCVNGRCVCEEGFSGFSCQHSNKGLASGSGGEGDEEELQALIAQQGSQ